MLDCNDSSKLYEYFIYFYLLSAAAPEDFSPFLGKGEKGVVKEGHLAPLSANVEVHSRGNDECLMWSSPLFHLLGCLRRCVSLAFILEGEVACLWRGAKEGRLGVHDVIAMDKVDHAIQIEHHVFEM
ncbi:hypothetical protein VNO78_30580 [Psophocarpus tetragonolobus]|uniref:Uncharacterized protein n=1 Tax=Psophocarpus tetragonolobus TaxID=3891 RepID=A0AAN9RX61_PSOTE